MKCISNRFKILIVVLCICLASVISTADNVPPSTNPPGNLKPNEVPLLVSIGWDDNSYAGMENSGNEGGMKWARDFFLNLKNPGGIGQKETFDGTPARVSFFMTSCYISSNPSSEASIFNLQWIYNAVYKDGHEIGNHSWNHTTYLGTSFDEWTAQLKRCNDDLVKPAPGDDKVGQVGFDFSFGAGVKTGDIVGWRTPFLQCNENTFKALASLKFLYDCSLEEGFHPDQNGTNFVWPYTLDNGSPGNEYLVSVGSEKVAIGTWPGMWEIPVYALPVPSAAEGAAYGLNYDLQEKIARNMGRRGRVDKLTGFDYNLWIDNANGGAHLTKEEFVAVMKHSIDTRLKSNRVPVVLGAHTDYYSSAWPHGSKTKASLRQRQEGIEEYIKYALSKPEVRVVPFKDIITWCRNPKPLQGTSIITVEKRVTPEIVVHGGRIRVSGLSQHHQLRSIEIRTLSGRLIQSDRSPSAPSNGCMMPPLRPGVYRIAVYGATQRLPLATKTMILVK